jgi:hypothetical protein
VGMILPVTTQLILSAIDHLCSSQDSGRFQE